MLTQVKCCLSQHIAYTLTGPRGREAFTLNSSDLMFLTTVLDHPIKPRFRNAFARLKFLLRHGVFPFRERTIRPVIVHYLDWA